MSAQKREQAEKLFHEGNELLSKGDYEGAAAKFQNSTGLAPTAAAAYNNWGNALY